MLCSKAFTKNEYYIVAAYEDNYLYLTGLHTKLDAATFFEKCYKGTLGFVVAGKVRPMTLLKGNELNMTEQRN